MLVLPAECLALCNMLMSGDSDRVCWPEFARDTVHSAPVSFHCAVEVPGLIIGFKIQALDPNVAINQTDVEFGVKRCICMGFLPYNRPDPWLRQTDNPPRDAVRADFKHEVLLFIYCRHQVHAALWGLRQYDAALHIFNNVSHISANVLKLFPNRLPNYLCAVLLPLHQIQIVFSGPFSIHSGLLQHVAVTHLVYDTLNLFSDTVQ